MKRVKQGNGYLGSNVVFVARNVYPYDRLAPCRVKTTQNSTGGTGTYSAGKLTKTEVSGKEDS